MKYLFQTEVVFCFYSNCNNSISRKMSLIMINWTEIPTKVRSMTGVRVDIGFVMTMLKSWYLNFDF